jgi:hypothetical protein
MDPDFVQNLMRHAAGRGIAPVPASGAGVDNNQYHVRKTKSEDRSKHLGKDLMEELKEKITEI